jgi:hypothetical protein
MKTDFDGIRTADAPGVGNGSARLAPAPYTAEWWASTEMRKLKMQALRRAEGRCERCGEPGQKLIPRLTREGFRKVDRGEALTADDFEAICELCLDIQRGKFGN